MGTVSPAVQTSLWAPISLSAESQACSLLEARAALPSAGKAKLPSPCLGVAIKGIIPVLSDSQSASALFPVCQAIKLPKGIFGAVIHEEFYSPAL